MYKEIIVENATTTEKLAALSDAFRYMQEELEAIDINIYHEGTGAEFETSLYWEMLEVVACPSGVEIEGVPFAFTGRVVLTSCDFNQHKIVLCYN